MIAKTHRLSKKDFEAVWQTGQKFQNELFFVKFSFSRPVAGFAFVVPKTVTNRAVRRNKIRRLGYDILHHFLVNRPKLPSAIFVTKKNAGAATDQEIKSAVSNILLKLAEKTVG
jgi:ribonuclease P protein component